ncbi:MAG: hypothetical protein AAF609_05305 [Cyanobacteria bacterium P01_C01_bin.120]
MRRTFIYIPPSTDDPGGPGGPDENGWYPAPGLRPVRCHSIIDTVPRATWPTSHSYSWVPGQTSVSEPAPYNDLLYLERPATDLGSDPIAVIHFTHTTVRTIEFNGPVGLWDTSDYSRAAERAPFALTNQFGLSFEGTHTYAPSGYPNGTFTETLTSVLVMQLNNLDWDATFRVSANSNSWRLTLREYDNFCRERQNRSANTPNAASQSGQWLDGNGQVVFTFSSQGETIATTSSMQVLGIYWATGDLASTPNEPVYSP